ncbi:MAG: ribonuclease HII [Clostridia bacterium]|nr:ribonuclease HII [Clostridia bacterium]
MRKEYNLEEKKKIENELYNNGFDYVGGADEVGRGPLAGPVVCAAVILPRDCQIVGIDDSKKLSEKKREELYQKIIDEAVAYNVEFVFHDEIDELNILQATKKCMAKAINGLKVEPDMMLIDALTGLDINCASKGIVHGDAVCYSIGAASIVAKVVRDSYMVDMDKMYPQYGFAKNKGYGTKEHMDALRKIGPCPIHRKSFIGFLDRE